MADASPLIALARLGLLELLPKLFGKVLVPQAVLDECLASARHLDGPPIREALAKEWLSPADEAVSLPAWNLGAGETSAIAVAQLREAGVIMDDQAGRRVAGQLGIDVIGTAGILILAKRGNLVERVAPLLDALTGSGYFLGDHLKERVLQLAGEE